MEHTTFLLITACLFGFIMSWGIGANDVANVMGTSVGSKAITIRQAILIATLFEFAGVFFAGDSVTNTIRSHIIDVNQLNQQPITIVYGMMATLLAAGIWLGVATHFGLPVSTTHTIIGAMMGIGWLTLGSQGIQWSVISQIVLSWFLTPLIAAIVANILFHSIQVLIFNTPQPLKQAKKWLPIYGFVAANIVCLATLNKAHVPIGFNPSHLQTIGITVSVGLVMAGLSGALIHQIRPDPKKLSAYDYDSVEKAFAKLMIFTACAMAFAHGSNDVANAIGPLSAVVDVLTTGGNLKPQQPLPNWLLYLGSSGIILGLVSYGYRVIQTIGQKITDLTPTRGFVAEFSAASTVVMASAFGFPVSTTQTLVGAIIGIGIARGISAINLVVIRQIFLSWLVTLPAGAVLSILIYLAMQRIF